MQVNVTVNVAPCCCEAARRPAEPDGIVFSIHEKGAEAMDIGFVMTDQQFATGHITPSNMDSDTPPKVFKNADGSDLDVSTLPVEYTSDDASVVTAGVDPAGASSQDFRFDSVDIGQTTIHARIGPYPNGNFAELLFGGTIVNSAPGAATATLTIADE